MKKLMSVMLAIILSMPLPFANALTVDTGSIQFEIPNDFEAPFSSSPSYYRGKWGWMEYEYDADPFWGQIITLEENEAVALIDRMINVVYPNANVNIHASEKSGEIVKATFLIKWNDGYGYFLIVAACPEGLFTASCGRVNTEEVVDLHRMIYKSLTYKSV